MKKLSGLDFKTKLECKNEHFKNGYFEIIGEFINCRTKIKVLTPYGICMTNPYSLLDGNKPTIQTAINKNEFFANIANEKHMNRYDYSEVNYINYSTKVIIICPEHGEFLQRPNNHINGEGCPKCNLGGWDFKLNSWLNTKNDSATFYILKCYSEDEEFIKIGITSEGIKDRFRKTGFMPYDFEIIHETTSTNKKMIWDMERKFMKKLSIFSYTPKIDFGGKTECFNIKALDLL